MKELLPIIFAIAYFAFKQYKKGKDNKPISQPKSDGDFNEGASSKLVPDLDDFITSFFGEQGLKPEVKPKVDFVEESRNVTSVVEEEQKEVQQPYSIEYDDNTTVVEENIDQFEMIKNKDKKSTQSVDFDLRNAVIYDAILNPPYISR